MKRKLILFAFAFSILGASAATPANDGAESAKVKEFTRVISLGAIQKTLLREAYVNTRRLVILHIISNRHSDFGVSDLSDKEAVPRKRYENLDRRADN